METKVIWLRLEVSWFSKDGSAGHSERKRSRRQKKRWEDNIKEQAGMDFASSTRTAENRTRWKLIFDADEPTTLLSYGIE